MRPEEMIETLSIVHQVEDGGILIIGIKGFIDSTNIDQFERQMYEQIENGHSKIILDFSEIQYINSSALGVILNMNQLAIKRQGSVRIINLPRKYEKTFELLGLNSYLQIFSEKEKALQSFT